MLKGSIVPNASRGYWMGLMSQALATGLVRVREARMARGLGDQLVSPDPGLHQTRHSGSAPLRASPCRGREAQRPCARVTRIRAAVVRHPPTRPDRINTFALRNSQIRWPMRELSGAKASEGSEVVRNPLRWSLSLTPGLGTANCGFRACLRLHPCHSSRYSTSLCRCTASSIIPRR